MDYATNGIATIGKYEYVFLHLRIQKAMLPDFDAAEAMELSTHEMATDLQRTASLPLRIPGGGEPAAGQERRSGAELRAANKTAPLHEPSTTLAPVPRQNAFTPPW